MNKDLILDQLKKIQNDILEITKLIYITAPETPQAVPTISPKQTTRSPIVKFNKLKEDKIKPKLKKQEDKKQEDKKQEDKKQDDNGVKFNKNYNIEDLKEFFNVNINEVIKDEKSINPILLIDKNLK